MQDNMKSIFEVIFGKANILGRSLIDQRQQANCQDKNLFHQFDFLE
jgi:hypothetical protein